MSENKVKTELDNLFLILREHRGTSTKIDRVLESEDSIRAVIMKKGHVADADLALAGLKEMGNVILDSGIPQAVLAFGVTYKLINGIAGADESVKQDLKITEW